MITLHFEGAASQQRHLDCRFLSRPAEAEAVTDRRYRSVQMDRDDHKGRAVWQFRGLANGSLANLGRRCYFGHGSHITDVPRSSLAPLTEPPATPAQNFELPPHRNDRFDSVLREKFLSSNVARRVAARRTWTTDVICAGRRVVWSFGEPDQDQVATSNSLAAS